MSLALVVVEENTWRTVQLANHHSFSAVDNKGTVVGHQRYGTEINLLLFNIPNVLGATVLVHIVDYEPHRDLDWRLIGHPPLQTLIHIILGSANAVADKLERGSTTKVANGEDPLKNALQTLVDAFIRIRFPLQKPFIGLSLHLYKVWDLDYVFDLAKTLPYSIVIGQ